MFVLGIAVSEKRPFAGVHEDDRPAASGVPFLFQIPIQVAIELSDQLRTEAFRQTPWETPDGHCGLWL
jgi:hypothetical protein